MRRLIALVALGGLLAAAVTVLYELGRRGLVAEQRRLEATSARARAQEMAGVREDVVAALSALRGREAARPYYQWKALYAPPDLVSNSLALVPSPLSEAPADPLIALYFEARGQAFECPALFTPPDLPQQQLQSVAPPSAAYQATCKVQLAALARSEVVTRALGMPPAGRPQREQRLDPYVVWATSNNADALASFNQPQVALNEQWTQSQQRVGKNPGMVGAPRPGAGAVIVREFPFAWVADAPGPDGWPTHLVALRRVQVGEESWSQGFEVDLAALRARALEPALARARQPAPPRSELLGLGEDPAMAPEARLEVVPLGAAGDAPSAALPAPLDGLAVVDRAPRTSAAPALAGSRRLLDGALLLAGCVVAAGSLLLWLAARGERRLAAQRADFVAALTHELKAPLTGLRALAELLHDGLVSDPAKQQEYYASMLDEAERLGRLVQNVLDAARLERGALHVAPEAFAPGPLLAEVCERFRARVEAQGFELALDLGDGDLPDARADREGFTQTVANLLDNAAKYGRGARRRIEVAAREAGGRLEVTVRDHGPGVAPAERERVFERFYRSEAAPREVGGAGLGLAIARAQARAAGGELALEDAGPGARFRLSLPLA
ncbi:MAG: sensor histidine kinase [Planctomycetota bacterium]